MLAKQICHFFIVVNKIYLIQLPKQRLFSELTFSCQILLFVHAGYASRSLFRRMGGWQLLHVAASTFTKKAFNCNVDTWIFTFNGIITNRNINLCTNYFRAFYTDLKLYFSSLLQFGINQKMICLLLVVMSSFWVFFKSNVYLR